MHVTGRQEGAKEAGILPFPGALFSFFLYLKLTTSSSTGLLIGVQLGA